MPSGIAFLPSFEVNTYWDERGVFQSTLGGL